MKSSPLRWAPALTLGLFLGPVAAGLLATALPAFGWMPSIGGNDVGLAPWRSLLAAPGLARSIQLTLATGVGATLLSLAAAVGIAAAFQGTAARRWVRAWVAPALSVPHVAVAVGLAFLIAPSGWIARLVSPWATGWQTPPDLSTLPDPYGLALVLGLTMKEVPYLLLMILAACGQAAPERRLAVARALGYGPVTAWLKVVLPAVYPQIRLPVYAVLAFSLSVVDMALILAPTTPPPLAVQVLRWFSDPDLSLRFQAAAGAVLQTFLVVAAIAVWRLGEILVARTARRWLADGRRRGGDGTVRLGAGAATVVLAGGTAAGILGMALWSVARRWRYPDALPDQWTTATWERHAGSLDDPVAVTVIVGLAATGAALILTLACLENERRHGLRPSGRGLWLLYAPLLVPQIGFLFGVQTILVWMRLDGTWFGLAWTHLLFVLPYLFLSLADPYRALDERYRRAALCLGASPNRVFRRVVLPMLARPVLVAAAIGFAVSVGQYLPTVFAGGGRLPTLTVEAVGLAAGADRRVMGVYVFLQAALPLLAFAAAGLARAPSARPERPKPGPATEGAG